MEVLYFLTLLNVSQIPVNFIKFSDNINIYGAHIDVNHDVNHVSTTTGTLERSSLYSKYTLTSSVLHNISISTGFLLQLSNLCLGCVFHKIKRSTRFFLFSLNEHEKLEIHQIDNAECLVQTVTNKVICDETEYVIQFIAFSCQLTRTQKQKLLKRQKYSEQKLAVSRKGKKWYAELEPEKKTLRLDTLRHYYYNQKQDILNGQAEKYKSMSASAKDNFLAKARCNECTYMKNQSSFPPCASRDQFSCCQPFCNVVVLLGVLNQFSL